MYPNGANPFVWLPPDNNKQQSYPSTANTLTTDRQFSSVDGMQNNFSTAFFVSPNPRIGLPTPTVSSPFGPMIYQQQPQQPYYYGQQQLLPNNPFSSGSVLAQPSRAVSAMVSCS